MSSIDFDLMQFESTQMLEVLNKIDKISSSQATVLISGAAGTGKTTLAQYIHRKSLKTRMQIIDLKRTDLDFIEEGFETVILENIEFASVDLQTFIFNQMSRVNFRNQRLIVTTRRDLKSLARQDKFRSDLLYRLSVIHLEIPSLFERKEDILNLSEFFLQVYGIVHGKSNLKLTTSAAEKLIGWSWPGNIRELENVIERAALLTNGPVVQDSELQFEINPEETTLELSVGMTLSEVEKRLILQTLELTAFNRTRAAQVLGISIRTLRNKLNEYRLEGAI